MLPALVLGGAFTVWSDIKAALDLGEFGAVFACNDAAATYPGEIEAAVTLHPEKMGMWMERRRRAGYPAPKAVIGHTAAKTSTVRIPPCVTGFADQNFEGQKASGSSGLFAAKVALIDYGYPKAVLCGVPMTQEGRHFFDPKYWGGANSHWRGWVEAQPAIKDRLRSMGGRSQDLLGAPTPEWLAS